jgi:hypothetical protein
MSFLLVSVPVILKVQVELLWPKHIWHMYFTWHFKANIFGSAEGFKTFFLIPIFCVCVWDWGLNSGL